MTTPALTCEVSTTRQWPPLTRTIVTSELRPGAALHGTSRRSMSEHAGRRVGRTSRRRSGASPTGCRRGWLTARERSPARWWGRLPGRAKGAAGGRQHRDLDDASTCLTQDAGGTGERAARGGHVVDHQHPPTRQPGARARRRAHSTGSAGKAAGLTGARSGPLPAGVAAGAAEVAPWGGCEQAHQWHLEAGGDARRDLLGVVAWQAAGGPRRDPGDQVRADPRGLHRRAEAASQRVESGGLTAQLAGEDRGAQGVAVGAERPHRHARVGRQSPWSRPGWLGRQAAGAAGPGAGRPAGEAVGWPEQLAQRGDDRHDGRLTGRRDGGERLSTPP